MSEPTAALVNALAYALARTQLPGQFDTSRDYAERLAPLVLESGYLASSKAEIERAAREDERAKSMAWERIQKASMPIRAERDRLREALERVKHLARSENDGTFDAASARRVRAINEVAARALASAAATVESNELTFGLTVESEGGE